MVFDNADTIMITSISLNSCSNTSGYVLRIFTAERTKSIYAKAIRKAWSESICCRKRKLTIKGNEVRIHLKKGDTVQKYIDCITYIIRRIKLYVNESRYMKLKMRMKHVKLRRIPLSKVFALVHSKNIRKAL